jgi:hypothetical protein
VQLLADAVGAGGPDLRRRRSRSRTRLDARRLPNEQYRVVKLVPFEEEEDDESPFVGLLRVEAA